MLGGISDLEILGRTMNTLNQAELLFADGTQCYLHLPIDVGLAAGVVLVKMEDIDQDQVYIAHCFGFRDTLVNNSCLVWQKRNQTWQEPMVVMADTENQKLFDELLKENQQYFVYPTHTYCDEVSKEEFSDVLLDDENDLNDNLISNILENNKL